MATKEAIMAKVIEDIIVVKLSRIVKDHEGDVTVVSSDIKEMLAATVPQLVEEIVNDKSVIVELAELG
jgi:histone H3/H4